jgi:hypothetical protein
MRRLSLAIENIPSGLAFSSPSVGLLPDRQAQLKRQQQAVRAARSLLKNEPFAALRTYLHRSVRNNSSLLSLRMAPPDAENH